MELSADDAPVLWASQRGHVLQQAAAALVQCCNDNSNMIRQQLASGIDFNMFFWYKKSYMYACMMFWQGKAE
jgi:hypothetical protein